MKLMHEQVLLRKEETERHEVNSFYEVFIIGNGEIYLWLQFCFLPSRRIMFNV